jgi:hypothetical protein
LSKSKKIGMLDLLPSCLALDRFNTDFSLSNHVKSSFSTFFLRKNNRKTPNKSRKTFHPFPHRGSRRPGLLQIFHEANWQLILQRALATRGGAATATGPDGSDTPMG